MRRVDSDTGESEKNGFTPKESFMRFVRVFSALCVLTLTLASVFAQAQTRWAVSKEIPLGGEGAWDYIAFDASTHRLFITRTTHTMVVDSESGKVLADIPGQLKAHGVAIVPASNRGFITDGGGKGAILVFDLTTYAVLGKLAALPDADGIIYDAGTGLLLVVSGDGNALLTFKPEIDPQTGKIDPPIQLGGAPEFLAADGQGKVFINLEDKGVVAAVDLKARKVLNRWPVAPGGDPVGMSIDTAHGRLYIGCRNPQKLVAMRTSDGKVEGALPIGAGVDATSFAEGQAFASTRDGALTVGAFENGKFTGQQEVKTALGARTLVVDAASHRIWLPTADFEADGAPRPKMKPGTFKIVVVEGK